MQYLLLVFLITASWDSAVISVTRLQPGSSRNCGSVLGIGKMLVFTPKFSDRTCSPSVVLFSGFSGLFLGLKSPKRDAHNPDLVRRLKTRQAIIPLLQMPFVAITGITKMILDLKYFCLLNTVCLIIN